MRPQNKERERMGCSKVMLLTDVLIREQTLSGYLEYSKFFF